MKPIEFECFFWSEEQSELNKIGIRPPIRECGKRPITFYSISHIKPYFEDDKEFSCICSGHEEYIMDMSYQELKKKLEE